MSFPLEQTQRLMAFVHTSYEHICALLKASMPEKDFETARKLLYSRTYVAGGCVRDFMQGAMKPKNDIDIFFKDFASLNEFVGLILLNNVTVSVRKNDIVLSIVDGQKVGFVTSNALKPYDMMFTFDFKLNASYYDISTGSLSINNDAIIKHIRLTPQTRDVKEASKLFLRFIRFLLEGYTTSIQTYKSLFSSVALSNCHVDELSTDTRISNASVFSGDVSWDKMISQMSPDAFIKAPREITFSEEDYRRALKPKSNSAEAKADTDMSESEMAIQRRIYAELMQEVNTTTARRRTEALAGTMNMSGRADMLTVSTPWSATNWVSDATNTYYTQDDTYE